MKKLLSRSLFAAGVAVSAGAAWLSADSVNYFRECVLRHENRKLLNLSEHKQEDLDRYSRINDEQRAWLGKQDIKDIEIKALDGLTLKGSFLSAKKHTNKYAIFFHGYRGSSLRNMALYAKFYHENGYNILFPDARAHGESDGKYIGYGILDKFDCLRWVEYANGAYGRGISIVLHGCSMGAATVLMASDLFSSGDNVKAIIADSGYTSVWDTLAYVLKRRYKKNIFPTLYGANFICRKLAGYSFKDCNSPEALSITDIPVFFIHGDADVLVPVEMTYKNYEACASEKELYIAKNVGHLGAYYDYKDEYEKRVKAFLKKYVR